MKKGGGIRYNKNEVMDRVLEAFRNWKPKFKLKTPKAFFFASPSLRKRRNKNSSNKKTPSRGSLSEGNEEEDEDPAGPIDNSPKSKSSDQRSYYCYTTTEDEDRNSSSTGASSLNLKDLPTSICELRKAILDVMVDQGLLLHSEAMEIYDNPKDEMHRRSSRTHLLYNFLWLPEHLRMGTCFVDFINFYCDDAEYLDELLQSKLRPSHQTDKIDPPPKEKLSSSVKDLVDVIEGKYYSFCLGRVVHEDEISHCARCRACFDHRYWHCDHCDRCSLGMSIGVCEHCGYRDVNESSGDSDEMSVCSVSELQ
ncbi:uncharacterized protein [Lepeophtheirus salmonis]|uniref:Uncharacterized protein n=1 Tax=Lepeophtheirus salmonis TaxID=72036 RepID=A0A0K2UED6_LEPSM|nr:uncharacterized protein LOC121120551 [Lepeophtheirus salmonis]